MNTIMLLAELLRLRTRRGTRSRSRKSTRSRNACDGSTPPEVALGVAYLSATRARQVSESLRGLKDALAAARKPPRLTLAQVDEALERLALIKGRAPPPSGRACSRAFRGRTAPEQDFSRGSCSASCARARSKDHARRHRESRKVRLSVYARGDAGGGLPAVAEAALTRAIGLARFALEVFRPVQPMLAQPARIRRRDRTAWTAAFEWKLDGARVQAQSGSQIRVYTRT